MRGGVARPHDGNQRGTQLGIVAPIGIMFPYVSALQAFLGKDSAAEEITDVWNASAFTHLG